MTTLGNSLKMRSSQKLNTLQLNHKYLHISRLLKKMTKINSVPG